MPPELDFGGGNWEEAYGKDAGEIFSAWHFGRAIEQMASAGKAVHPIPCFVNA